MKRLKWIIPLVIAVIIAAAAAFVLSRGTVGYCIVADNGSRILVVDGGPVVLSNSTIGKNALYKYDTGDKLLVVHGAIRESYPASADAYFCMKIGEGSAKDIPDEVFKGLYELDWLSEAYLDEIGIPSSVSYDTPFYAFTAQYVRTDAAGDPKDFPAVLVLRSYEEFTEYIAAHREEYQLDLEFIPACSRYDEEYFAKNDLILIRLEESSGSISHEVTDVYHDDDGWQIRIDRVTPEERTDDMAQWHILLEIQMGKVVNETSDINLVINSYTPVSLSYGDHIMKMNIPESWVYEYVGYDENPNFAGIRFRPEVETDGWASLYYYPNGFGVCGTDLEERELRLTHGFRGLAGYYCGSDVWSFITINGVENWAFWNDSAQWLREYDMAFAIVASTKASPAPSCCVEYDQA